MRTSPLIIGVSGRKRHGKDQVATTLMKHFGVHRLAFADYLKWIAMQVWGLSFEQAYGADIHKEGIDPRWNRTPRHFFQILGTEIGRQGHPETWVRKTFDTIQRAHAGESVVLPDMDSREFREFRFPHGEADVWAVPDCRFPSEADAIKAIGGLVIKVVRPGMPTGDTHASETEVDNVKEDYLIVNDGSLADLEAKVLAIAAEILS